MLDFFCAKQRNNVMLKINIIKDVTFNISIVGAYL